MIVVVVVVAGLGIVIAKIMSSCLAINPHYDFDGSAVVVVVVVAAAAVVAVVAVAEIFPTVVDINHILVELNVVIGRAVVVVVFGMFVDMIVVVMVAVRFPYVEMSE
jgi:hypothetical protein